jgi:hypothetical protein
MPPEKCENFVPHTSIITSVGRAVKWLAHRQHKFAYGCIGLVAVERYTVFPDHYPSALGIITYIRPFPDKQHNRLVEGDTVGNKWKVYVDGRSCFRSHSVSGLGFDGGVDYFDQLITIYIGEFFHATVANVVKLDAIGIIGHQFYGHAPFLQLTTINLECQAPERAGVVRDIQRIHAP